MLSPMMLVITLIQDGDGYADEVDAFPNDARYHLDSDGDGYADEVDAFPNDARYHSDYDGDGYADEVDAFPTDPHYHAICPTCGGTGVIKTSVTKWVEYTHHGRWENVGVFNPDYYGYVEITNVDSQGGSFEVYAWFEDNGVEMWGKSSKFYIAPGTSHTFVFHYDADEEMDRFNYRVIPPTYTEYVENTCPECGGTGRI